ncbi:MAG TPA: XdhC/CoxI family protein [Chloroflexota bacterium]|jgi:xanthine dehydrogenase accessory factor|nr:XdhC/CoxI family protein [Chloroflexota bacterium]
MTLYDSIRDRIAREEAFVVATVIAGPEGVGRKVIIHSDGRVEGDLGMTGQESAIIESALACLARELSDTASFEVDRQRYEVFFDSFVPPPKLVIVGAVETAQALTRFAKQLGYRVIVTDARAAFVTPERFPEADELLKGWPQDVLPGIRFDDSTYVVLLSHDPKFDEPTLRHILPLAVKYIGAIGSRRTQQQRRERLLAEGFDAVTVDAIHGPIGLDLGGRSAEETAISILAEVTAVRHGKTGGMLGRAFTNSRAQESS